MKTTATSVLFLLFIFVPFAIAQEVEQDEIGAEWNNSTSVEFPATSTDEEGNIIYNYYGDDSQYFGGDGNNEPDDDEEDESEEESGEVVIPLNDPAAAAAAAAAAQALLDSLAANDALTGNDGTLSAKDFDFFFGSGGGTDFRLLLGGGLIRETMKAKGIEKITLEGWDPKKNDQNIINWIPKTNGDLSIIAAAAIVRDANIEEVQLLLNRIDVSYRLKGYLFYLIPFNFTARIGVNPTAVENSRVTVSYPWYQFFLWKPITSTDLKLLLENEVTETLTIQMANDLERQGRLFGSVADALRGIQQP